MIEKYVVILDLIGLLYTLGKQKSQVVAALAGFQGFADPALSWPWSQNPQ